MLRCLILIACFLSLLCGSRGYAADMYCLQDLRYDTDPRWNGKDCAEIHIEGEIVAGDYQRFRDLLHFAEPYVRCYPQLARRKRRRGASDRQADQTTAAYDLGTQSPSRRIYAEYILYSAARKRDLCSGRECVCASACFLIWAGSIERSGDTLMVHRPRDGSGTFATKAAAQASREYSATLSAIDSYLLEMEVPPSIIEKAKNTPSNEIAFVAFEDVLRMKRPPSIAEWLISGCGSVREDENEWIRQLHRFEEGQLHLTPQQVAYARRLENARDAVWSCEINKITAERKRLAQNNRAA